MCARGARRSAQEAAQGVKDPAQTLAWDIPSGSSGRPAARRMATVLMNATSLGVLDFNSKALLLTNGLSRPLPNQAMRGTPAAALGYPENLNSKHMLRLHPRGCSVRGLRSVQARHVLAMITVGC